LKEPFFDNVAINIEDLLEIETLDEENEYQQGRS
jgi:hypothetical protein